MKAPDRFQWYGTDRVEAGRVGLAGFTLPGFAPAELAAILDGRFDIAVRAGLHCAPEAHRHLGTLPYGTVRISVGLGSTEADVVTAAEALNEIAEA